MMPAQYDAVIAGGGLAGLSLAVRLPAIQVLIVDDPAANRVQRWGFWSRSPGPLDAAISQRFTTIRLYAQGSERILPVEPYTYNVVHRSDLDRVAEKLLATRQDLHLIEGHVTQLRSLGDCAEVVVDGEPIRAAWAFDARGSGPDGPGTPDARLAFAGWEVACGRPCFDPGALTLFDFRTPQHDIARFVYAVPDGATRALVEAVAFVPRHHHPPSTHDLTGALESYLDGIDYSIERREEAVVALRIQPPDRAGGRVVPLGARAGLIKAATGYAFQRIQADSAAVADSLQRYGHPYGVRRSRWRHRMLDAVLLRALDRDPALLEIAFDRLFAGNPAERVLRFLDEETGLHDELRLIASLPIRPFLGGLTHHGRTLRS